MTMLPDQPTNITVRRSDRAGETSISISLAPVLMGTGRDHYEAVEMLLTTGEARRLRDDLTETLAGLAETKRMDGSR